MDIHQVSVNYQQEQDRLLVRINTRQDEEIRLWLTRRLCASWVPALRDALERIGPASPNSTADASGLPGNRSTTAAAAHHHKHTHNASDDAPDAQATDFSTPYKANAQTLPLGSEPLLVTTVRMTVRLPDKLDIAFEETLTGRQAQARGFQASLEGQLAQGILQLLEQALDNSDWGLPPEHADLDDLNSPNEGLSDDLSSPPSAEDFGNVSARPKRAKYLH